MMENRAAAFPGLVASRRQTAGNYMRLPRGKMFPCPRHRHLLLSSSLSPTQV